MVYRNMRECITWVNHEVVEWWLTSVYFRHLLHGVSTHNTYLLSLKEPSLIKSSQHICDFYKPITFKKQRHNVILERKLLILANQDFSKSNSGLTDGKFCWGGILFIWWWKSEEDCVWPFEPFSKLKKTFCKYLTSIKIKVSTTCLYKEY